MWLLNFHFSVSVLCLITFVGFTQLLKSVIKENGYLSEKKRKVNILSYLIFLVPILNIVLVFVGFIMIAVKKEDLEKWRDEVEKERDNG